MKINMFDNILRFTCLFLSGDLQLLNQSPDYFIEKFEYFIGTNIEIKKHDRNCKMYEKNLEIWKVEDYRINSILLFLLDVILKSDKYKYEDYNLIRSLRCKPDDMLESFNKWIGNPDDVDKSKKSGRFK